jgi:molecular chaperone GrpE (heat shock protein)
MDRKAGADVTSERLDQISKLLEEVVDDNTAVVASMNRLSQVQESLGSDVAREISALRTELTGALNYRTLKDLCTELIGPLAAMEAMLDVADFSDTEAIAGHVRSLSVTLRGVLDRMGAEKVVIALGDDLFDPNRHRCVGVLDPEDSPFPVAAPRTVVRVVEDGYLLDHRLLTPATVEIQAGRAAHDGNNE